MTSPCHRSNGFSLVELMAAMAVGALILLAAAAMLGSAGAGYGRVGGAVAAEREARTLLARLMADLASARFHKDGVLEKSSAAWRADRLGFLCLQPAMAQSDAGRIGDLCAVHYYLKDLSIGGKTVRCLMRGCRESKETFTALEDGRVGSLFAEHHPADEPVAFGVVSFVVRPKTRDPSGRWQDWIQDDPAGPEALDVSLVLVRRELAGRLRLPVDWDGAGTAGDLLGEPAAARRNANLEVCATLIPFGHHHESPQISAP